MTSKRINEVKSITKKRGTLTIEFFDNEGKIRQKDTGLSPTKSNRTKLKRLIPEFEMGLREKQEAKQIRTFGQYADLYLELSKDNSQIGMRRGHVKRLLSYFGKDIYPKDIKLSQVKRFFNSLCKADGTPIVRNTKTHWRQTIKSILQLAFEDGEADRNIVALWQLPKQDDPPKNIKPFTKEEVKMLLGNSEGKVHNYIGIGVHTGLRPEELIALMPGDIDFKKKIISVNRAFAKQSSNTHTKTYESMRNIPLFDDAILYLKAQIDYAKTRKSMYLFCKEDGSRPICSEDITGKPSYIDKNGKLQRYDGPWHVCKKKSGLPNAKIHWTRHTFAVQALKSKYFTPQEVAGIMGITLETLFEHYARYIGDEHTKVDRSISLFSA